MLREIKKTSQKPDEPRKRWFSGPEMDLFIWFDPADEILSYQLSYNKLHGERVLTWKRGHGFDHLGVDEGARPGKHPASPLLVKDGALVPSTVVSLLERDASELDPEIRHFIISGIQASFS